MTKQLMITKAIETKITNSQELQDATTLLLRLKEELKITVEHKETVTKPLLEALNAERAKYKPREDAINQAILHIRSEQKNYNDKQLEIQQEALKRLKAEDSSFNDTIVAFATPTITGLKFRTDKKLSIVTLSKIPRKYLIPNEQLILDDLKAGKKVTGCELKEVQTPVNR